MRLSRLLTLALLGLLVLTTTAAAKDDKKKGGKPDPKAAAAAAAAEKDKPFAEWSKTIKDATVQKGFFDTYRKRENLYLAIRPDQLDVPILGIFSFSRGIGTNFTLGGLPLNDRVLRFQRHGDRVLVLEDNTRFMAAAGSPMQKAVELSMGPSVLAALKIESIHDSTKTVLVDFAPFLVSDVSDLAAYLQAFTNKSMRFDKERSALTTLKTFPENLEVEALLTYSPNDRMGLSLEGVADERFVPLGVHYSFSKLPEKPMPPRLADPRVGHFLTAMKDFSRDTLENFWVRYVNRWRLEKKDPSAAVSEPVKPITYYIDHTVPKEYRAAVKQGVELWQKAYEAAGFKRGIVAVDAPDDSLWDAEDVRYSTIRWITSTQPAFGAIGPSRVDPRTGEILDADILVEASMIQSFRNVYRRFSGPDAMADEVLPATRLKHLPAGAPLEHLCDAAGAMADGAALLNIALLMDGVIPPGSPVPDDYVNKAIVWVVAHEVGHTLGLRHNFRGSTATPYEKLNDPAWTGAHGLYNSVMEYPSVNVSRDRSKQGEYYTSTVGTEDVWRIRYAYTPTGAADAVADYAVVSKIADESMQAGHEYSTDDDTYPANALDPRSNIFDLGDDPLAYAQDRAAYLKSLWQSPNFEPRILGEGGEYPSLRRAMDTVLGQYGQALGMGVKYVGGQYSTRVRKGQPGEVAPLVPVPAAEQREALDFLSKHAFAADAFEASPELLNKLASDRWSHWGMNSWTERLDYDLNGRALAMQTALLGGLTAPSLLARLREAENKSAEPFTLAEHMDKMTRMLWGEVGASAGPGMKALAGPNTRREVQRLYVDRLADLVVEDSPGAPDDARALARLQLQRIDTRCGQALAGSSPVPDAVRAHLLETRARIKRALEAGREADAAVATPRPPGMRGSEQAPGR